jgi:hypothetical protein
MTAFHPLLLFIWPADDGRQPGCRPCPADRVVKGCRQQVEPDPAEMATRQRLRARLERVAGLLIMRPHRRR